MPLIGYTEVRSELLAFSNTADVSVCMLQQLPEFPPPEGERRSMSFRRVLLNTCQEEFEGAAAAREVCTTLISEWNTGLS